MTTFQVELPDELAAQIQLDAERGGIPVNDVIHRAIREIYSKPMTLSGVVPGRRQTFEEALKATVAENDELYRRLAQ